MGRVVKSIGGIPREYSLTEEAVEYYVSQKCSSYNAYKTGDIVYVREYNYASGNIGHDHLFVIVDKDINAIPIEYLGVLISSKLKKTKYKGNIILKKNRSNNLIKDSIVKTDVIYAINIENIICKIGKVDNETLKLLKDGNVEYA